MCVSVFVCVLNHCNVWTLCVCACPSECDWHAEAGGPPLLFQWWLASLLTWKHKTHTRNSKAHLHTCTHTHTRTLSRTVTFRPTLRQRSALLTLLYHRKCLSGMNMVHVVWRRSLGCCGFSLESVLLLHCRMWLHGLCLNGKQCEVARAGQLKD